MTDVTPTLLDLARARDDGSRSAPALLRPEGRSLVDLLQAREQEVRGPRDSLGSELFFRRAVRRGDWKAVYLPGNPLIPYQFSASLPARWELYNLRRDPGETTDLADRYPRLLSRLVRSWDAYAERTGVVLPSAATAAAQPIP